jgi:uncharacterized protein (UPF0335 family)
MTHDTTTSAEATNKVSSDCLRSYVERLERLGAEAKEIADQKKLVMAEAKAEGYATKYIAAICKLRLKPPSERDEDEAMMDMYQAAMGMARELPLFRSIQSMAVDTTARESILEALKLLAPEDGEITIRVGSGPRMRLWRTKDGVHVEEVISETPARRKSDDDVVESAASRAKSVFPDVSIDEAFDLGSAARLDDQPVIANPFPWDDKRRRSWDEGWRAQDGGDGMGPQ